MTAHILRSDAARLPLTDSSVDLIVTSPPYFGLRSYTDGGEHYDGQIGAEPNPREYIAALLTCTREWTRVLKPSGSIFVNLGDKYATQNSDGVRTKSLFLLPELYRVGCVYDLGLIARATLIWSKLGGSPDSATDRVGRSHEDWVHLTKTPRYYSGIDTIREPLTAPGRTAGGTAFGARNHSAVRTSTGNYDGPSPLGKLPGSVWDIATEPLKVPDHVSHARCCSGRKRTGCADGVDHFAAFPIEWPRRIIQGWSPSGICTVCGEGRRPVPTATSLDMSRPQARRAAALAATHGLTAAHIAAVRAVGVSDTGRGAATQTGTGKNTDEVYALAAVARKALGGYAREFLLQRPSSFGEACGCPDTCAPTRPAVVLDPFGGTGTTALVASALGRVGISVDMSADYCHLAQWRTTDPAEMARAMRVPKPPAQVDGQEALFDGLLA